MQIRAEGLARRYPRGIVALKSLTLTLDRGAVHGLLGPNGAGKSTLLRLCATLDQPTTGILRIHDWDVRQRADRRAIRQRLGYLPQVFAVSGDLTPVEYLAYMCSLKALEGPAAREIDRVLEAVNMTAEAHRRMGTFSGGMKQRIGLAQALLGTPQLLLLDEPTAGLDPHERSSLRNLLADMAAQCLIVLSTHIVEDVAHVCSQVAVLYQGQLRFHGSPAAMVAQAQGHIWEVETDTDLVLAQARLLGRVPSATGTRYRLIADTQPHPEARLVTVPTLEDGYLYLCGTDMPDEAQCMSRRHGQE